MEGCLSVQMSGGDVEVEEWVKIVSGVEARALSRSSSRTGLDHHVMLSQGENARLPESTSLCPR
jgi:hypothetical protein